MLFIRTATCTEPSDLSEGIVAIRLARRGNPAQAGDSALLAPVNGGLMSQGPEPPTDYIGALREEILMEELKILRGFEIYKNNTGAPHPLSPEIVSPGGDASLGIASNSSSTERLKGHRKVIWTGSIDVGNPPREFSSKRVM